MMLYKELNCGVNMPMLGFGTFRMKMRGKRWKIR